MASSETSPAPPTGERRRSQRVLLRVPVVVHGLSADGRPFQEETHTLVVNAHGALIAVGVSVARGQKLVLTHHSTGEEQQCQVVHIGQEYHGKTEVAVEFLHPAPHFWHISFPPRDWKQVKT